MCPKSRAEPAGKFNWRMKRCLGGRDPLQPHRPKPHTYQMTTFKSGREREREEDRETGRKRHREGIYYDPSAALVRMFTLPTRISHLIRFPEFTYQMKG